MQLEALSQMARRPLRPVLALAMLALLAWEFHADGRLSAFDPLPWMQLALILISPIVPRLSCAALLGLGIASMFVCAGDPFSLTGALYALAMLSYDTCNTASAVLTALMIIAQSIHVVAIQGTDQFDVVELPGFAIPYALAALLGRSLRWREAMLEARRREESYRIRLEQAHANARTAQELHDAVTGELSLIARLAQRRMRHSSPPQPGDWERINRSALTALDDVHRIIDRLDKDTGNIDVNGSGMAAPDAALSRLRNELSHGDEVMAALGFEGHSLLDIETTEHDASAESEVSQESEPADAAILDWTTSLIRELYANIERHAASDGPYSLSVVIRSDDIHIRQTNVIDRTGETARMRGGHGLAHMRREICRRHGTLTTDRDGGIWTLEAWIPTRRAS